jgi:putative Mg2+ transporter-C (MgtC) family protein
MQAIFFLRLLAAAVLASVIGLERRLRYKSAGLRTHTVVGLGAALLMIVSQHGFREVIRPGWISLDPSRVAAQVVSGIGFLGAGLIFVRRDSVRGLTTAAGIWLCAAIGLACGAGMQTEAVMATVLYVVLVPIYTWIEIRWLTPRADEEIEVVCRDEAEVLAALTRSLEAAGGRIENVAFERTGESLADGGSITYRLKLLGGGVRGGPVAALRNVPGIERVARREPED